jgi:Flp pilus assembly protein TadD
VSPAQAATEENSRYGALLRMAASTRQAGDPESAVRLYQQAIAGAPERTEAYLLLGEALLELEAYDQAAQAFEAAIEHDDALAEAHRGYARALLGIHRPDGAIPHFRLALELQPGDPQMQNGLAVALDMQGEHEAAQALYREALAATPDSLLLRNNYGLSLALSGHPDAAIEVLEAVALEPGARPRNRQNLALAYGLAGDLEAAEQISRLDLDEDVVQNNLRYFATLAAINDPALRAAALGADSVDLGPAPDGTAGLKVIALEGGDVELGFATAGRWFVNLGDQPSTTAANAAWRDLKGRNPMILGNLNRLAGTDAGLQPLLAGPLADADQAQRVCTELRAREVPCIPVPL